MKKLALLVILVSNLAFSQVTNLCAYSNGTIPSPSELIGSNQINDDYIVEILNSIKKSIGIEDYNFVIYRWKGFNNCAAANYYGSRLIIYDPDFLYTISNRQKYVITSILAHEVAHHLFGHTLEGTDNLEQQRKRELEADYLSGIIMKKLGYSLNQAIEGVSKLADDYGDTYFTHPLREKRNLAITNVYNPDKIMTEKNGDWGEVEISPNKIISQILDYTKQQALEDITSKNYERGQELFYQKNYHNALTELNKVTKPNDLYTIFAKVTKIDIYRQLENEQKALETALSLEQDSFVKTFDYPRFLANAVYFNIAGSYELLGNKTKAIEYLNKVYELLPDDKITKAKIGMLHSGLGNYTTAIKYLEDQTLEDEFFKVKFSPRLFKKLFDARLKSFEKANKSSDIIKAEYNKIIYKYSELFSNTYLWSDDDTSNYITNGTFFLINDFEKNKNAQNGMLIYNYFQKYKTLKEVSETNSTSYLTILENFYKKYASMYDDDHLLYNEIITLKK